MNMAEKGQEVLAPGAAALQPGGSVGARERQVKLQPPWVPLYLLLGMLVPALLVAFGVWLDSEYGRMRQTGDLIDRIATRRYDALDLLASLRKAETAQRGFVITGDPAYLRLYEPSRQMIAKDLRALERPSGLTTTDRARIAILRDLVSGKFSEMDTVLKIAQQQGRTAAVAYVSNGRGQGLMDRIERTLQQVIAADNVLVDAGRERFWVRTHRSQQIVWLLVIIVGAMMLGGMLLLWLSRRERWRVMVSEADASARNRAILDSTSDAIVILNPSGTIENVNASARTVLGYSPAELMRRDVSVALDIAEGEGSFHERIGFVEGSLRRTLFVDRNARTKDGRVIPVDVALGLMPLPDGMHIVASIRDISHRREIERVKDDFIATVSHELRTPLTSVVGSLGLLRAGAVGVLPESATQLVEIAESNARRLIRLTNDILDLEKFGTGQMSLDMTSVDLNVLLREAIAEGEALAAAKSLALHFSSPDAECMVLADRQRLLQVAANLLSNAIRHTPAASTVTVRLDVEQGRATTRISDEGSGVPAEYREHIFDRFVQAPRPGAPGGSGLGLAIAREIVHRHGGTIWVETAGTGGACFAFALNCISDEQPQELAGPGTRRSFDASLRRTGGDCPTILQIDDDEDLVKVVAASLAGEARVIRADGLASARALLAREQPDLVLLDIGLPDGSGVDVLPLLVDRNGAPLPIVVFTAQDSPLEISGRVEAVLVKSHSSLQSLCETLQRILIERGAYG